MIDWPPDDNEEDRLPPLGTELASVEWVAEALSQIGSPALPAVPLLLEKLRPAHMCRIRAGNERQ
jgi:hypothetical protein